MTTLPNNCRAGKFTYFPKDWKTVKANKSLLWKISYWFYDNAGIRKKVVIKSKINKLETLKEKQAAMEFYSQDELNELKAGYSPFEKRYVRPANKSDQLTPETPFLEALQFAYTKLKCVPEYKLQFKSMLKYLEPAMIAEGINNIPINEIRREHIKRTLDACRETKWKGRKPGDFS